MGLAECRAVAAEATATQGIVEVGVLLDHLASRGGLLGGFKRRYLLVAILNETDIEFRLRQHLAAQGALLAVSAGHSIVGPLG
ncbi:MAG: hypothetical protein HGA54_08475 [Actinobacteria bacterium]|nr:hypothetical protein [Actinomycetota bacterium]